MLMTHACRDRRYCNYRCRSLRQPCCKGTGGARVFCGGSRNGPDFGVAGECGPFAPERYDLPMPPHRMNWHAQLLARGARKLGAQPFAPPIAINSVEYHGRPACTYCGWCGSGCSIGAKATASGTYLAKAERRGATVKSEAFVHRINFDGAKGRVTGVNYLDAQKREHQ